MGTGVSWEAVGSDGVDGDDGGGTAVGNLIDKLIALCYWNVFVQCWVQRILQCITAIDCRGH